MQKLSDKQSGIILKPVLKLYFSWLSRINVIYVLQLIPQTNIPTVLIIQINVFKHCKIPRIVYYEYSLHSTPQIEISHLFLKKTMDVRKIINLTRNLESISLKNLESIRGHCKLSSQIFYNFLSHSKICKFSQNNIWICQRIL